MKFCLCGASIVFLHHDFKTVSYGDSNRIYQNPENRQKQVG